jgi:hypothetical protein
MLRDLPQRTKRPPKAEALRLKTGVMTTWRSCRRDPGKIQRALLAFVVAGFATAWQGYARPLAQTTASASASQSEVLPTKLAQLRLSLTPTKSPTSIPTTLKRIPRA